MEHFSDSAALNKRQVELTHELEADGWTHLPNRRTELAAEGVRLEVMGMDDPHIERHVPNESDQAKPTAW